MTLRGYRAESGAIFVLIAGDVHRRPRHAQPGSEPAGAPSLDGLAGGPGELTFTMTRGVQCTVPN